ncbi:NUMOD4 domain-containing protein [Herbaspirillum huttiense]|uniref:NUMOD4 domain-containing protein n=1 Tax=Herbaspirillum huttiense TaxID=863372 RepID=UPI0031D15791
MEEVWVPVIGYEGSYEVSNKGAVRSVVRTITYKGRWGMTTTVLPQKVLSLNRTPAGYLDIQLSRDGRHKHHLIHRLVAAAFIGASDLQINHKDGDKENNSVLNLEYCTSQENLLHCTRVLKKKIGEGSGSAKLKADDILKIRSDHRVLREIAADYGVSLQAISYVKRRKNWGHIE